MNEYVIKSHSYRFLKGWLEMFSKKRKKQLKKFIKKAKKSVEKEELKDREREEDESWMRKIARHFW